MPKYDADARASFVELIREGLAEAGFTGIQLAPAQMPDATVAALKSGEDDDDDEAPFDDPAFSEEVAYHRVMTEQGSFGLWFEPYMTLDLSGTGIPIKDFYPPEAASDIPEGWAFIGLEEDTFRKLFKAFGTHGRQP